MTPLQQDILKYLGILAAAVVMVFVVRWRRKGHQQFLQNYAAAEVCPHLKPAFELLRSRGHVVVKAGQYAPEYPLELHLAPRWEPKAILEELQLEPPVYLSERNVLFCKECMCELHPA